MMEFLLSRVCLSVCGLLLLVAVIAPVTGMYDSNAMFSEGDIADDVARLTDDFYYSEMDTAVIAMCDILPNVSSYIEFDGHSVTLMTERGTYRSGTNVPVAAEGAFGYGDMIMLTKNDVGVTAERVL